MVYEVQHYIEGKKVTSQKKLPIYNPATGAVAGEVDVADAKLVDTTVNAARKAFATWSLKPAAQRAKILFRFKTLLDQNIHELAKYITAEHGKTLTEAVGSIQRGIDVVEFACAAPHHLRGGYSENVTTGMDTYSLRQPLGVCVGITPFNFPAMIALWMFPLSIVCGNTFILKPSEKDPSCALHLAELAREAGVPDGVLNVLNGDKETVDALITHPLVDAISFVGSSAVAEHVYRTGIAHHKRVQAFGGAKNHCIVLPDADLDLAADAIVTSAYGSTGQRCMAISVVVTVGDEVADQLLARMQPKIQQLKIGAGVEENIDMGPLVTKELYDRVNHYVELGKKEGAKLVIDGTKYQLKQPGFFMGASLFDHVTPKMQIYRDEIFGPVLCIVRVDSFDEALKLVNEHEYGNGTAIFTSDGFLARAYAEKVQVGMVGINVPVPVPVAYHSFGGWKRSIFSDIGMYGEEAIRFYTKLKTVTERWVERKTT